MDVISLGLNGDRDCSRRGGIGEESVVSTSEPSSSEKWGESMEPIVSSNVPNPRSSGRGSDVKRRRGLPSLRARLR